MSTGDCGTGRLFDLAIDSKLRGCDLVKLKIGDVVSGGDIRNRSTVIQRKTGKPIQFEIMSEAQRSLTVWLERRRGNIHDFLFPTEGWPGAEIAMLLQCPAGQTKKASSFRRAEKAWRKTALGHNDILLDPHAKCVRARDAVQKPRDGREAWSDSSDSPVLGTGQVKANIKLAFGE